MNNTLFLFALIVLFVVLVTAVTYILIRSAQEKKKLSKSQHRPNRGLIDQSTEDLPAWLMDIEPKKKQAAEIEMPENLDLAMDWLEE